MMDCIMLAVLAGCIGSIREACAEVCGDRE